MSAIRKYKKKFDRKQIHNNTEVFKLLYENLKEDCYIKIFNKITNRSKFYNVKSMLEEHKVDTILNSFYQKNLFSSVNTFKTMSNATQSNLFTIQALPIDVDFDQSAHWKFYTPLMVIDWLEQEYFDNIIPRPTLIEFDNNLRLLYILEEPLYVANNTELKTLVRRIEESIADALKEFNASAQQIHTFFRPAGSINTRNGGKEIEIIQVGNKISFDELKEWLPQLPEWYQKWLKQKKLRAERKTKKGTKTKKVISLNNVNTLNQRRINDFEILQSHLNDINATKGFRHQLCFLYFNLRLQQIKMLSGQVDYELTKEDYRTAIDDTLEYNSKFDYPLYERELEGLYRTQMRYNKVYRFKNETLVNLCEVDTNILNKLDLSFMKDVKTQKQRDKEYYSTHKEIISDKKVSYYNEKTEEINLRVLKYYEENKEEINTKRRKTYKEKVKTSGKLSRDEQNTLIREQIKELLEQGFKQQEIADKLSLGIATVKRHIKYIKENQ